MVRLLSTTVELSVSCICTLLARVVFVHTGLIIHGFLLDLFLFVWLSWANAPCVYVPSHRVVGPGSSYVTTPLWPPQTRGHTYFLKKSSCRRGGCIPRPLTLYSMRVSWRVFVHVCGSCACCIGVREGSFFGTNDTANLVYRVSKYLDGISVHPLMMYSPCVYSGYRVSKYLSRWMVSCD